MPASQLRSTLAQAKLAVISETRNEVAKKQDDDDLIQYEAPPKTEVLKMSDLEPTV